MHITKERLKKLIKEEFGRMSEIDEPPQATAPPGPEAAVPGPEAGAGPGKVDVAGTLKKVKQTLIAGGAAEDQYLSALLDVVSALVVGTNIATDTIALRALNLLKDRAAKLG